MDRGPFRKLNALHVIFLVQNVLVGEGLLSLPHLLSPAGYHQWILPIAMALIAQLTLYPMIWLAKQYPNDNLFKINEQLLGKWMGSIINVFFIAYMIATVVVVCNSYLNLVMTTILTETTITMPLLLLFFVMFVIVNGGIKSIARFSIMSFFLTGWMIIFLQWGFQRGHTYQLFSVWDVNMANTLQAIIPSYEGFLGYELIMIYFPYILKPNKAYRHASYGIWITVGFYMLVTMTSVLYFSQWQLSNLLYPSLNLYKAVELSFVQRIENLGISLWVFLTLSTIAAYLWAGKKGIDTLLGQNRMIHLYIILGISFFTARIIAWYVGLHIFDEWSLYAGFVMLLWPCILIPIHWVKQLATKRRASV